MEKLELIIKWTRRLKDYQKLDVEESGTRQGATHEHEGWEKWWVYIRIQDVRPDREERREEETHRPGNKTVYRHLASGGTNRHTAYPLVSRIFHPILFIVTYSPGTCMNGTTMKDCLQILQMFCACLSRTWICCPLLAFLCHMVTDKWIHRCLLYLFLLFLCLWVHMWIHNCKLQKPGHNLRVSVSGYLCSCQPNKRDQTPSWGKLSV